jgi:ABC-type multidrug transport system fused ATPase/permease subunit
MIATRVSESVAPTTGNPPAFPGVRGVRLASLLRRYRWRLLFTYGLFNVESVLRLVQPYVLGMAINGLLEGSYRGLGCLVLQHVLLLVSETCRRMYDTRVFTRIYSDLAASVVLDPSRRDDEVTYVAALSTLSRQLVDFLEFHFPILMRAFYSLVGALIMLAWLDGVLVTFCLVLVLPAGALNLVYSRKSLTLSRGLHTEYEREVAVINRRRTEEVRGHFERMARWRVRLSDWGALTTGLMEWFILGLMIVVLLRSCTLGEATAGTIFAKFRYVLLFILALDDVPLLVEQTSRLRDILCRMRSRVARKPDGSRRAEGREPGETGHAARGH